MRCRECGFEVENDKAFCPICGAPMKVTADYDYIQAEIANKVDRFFNEEDDAEADAASAPSETLKDDVQEASLQEERVKVRTARKSSRGQRSRSAKNVEDTAEEQAKTKPISKTKPVFGNDSVFEEEEEPYQPEEEERSRPRSSAGRRRTRQEDYRRSDRQPYREPRPQKSQTAARVITALIIFIIIAAAAIGVMAISGMFHSNSRNSSTENAKSSLTSNLVAGETYAAPVEVIINKDVDGNIFYTLDGSEPSIDSKMYTGPFQISPSDVPLTYPDVTLRAISFSQNSEKSGDLNISFKLDFDQAAADALVQETTTEAPTQTVSVDPPMISPSSGSYSSDTQILVSAQSGASIYYTYDGTMPTTRSNLYVGPVKMIPGNSTFSAMCVLDGAESAVTTVNYTLEYGYNTSSGTAMSSVINNLLWNGNIIDYDCNTSDGYASLRHLGVYEIGGYTYYVIQVDFYNADGVITDTQYRGVGVNYGNVYYLAPDGDSFYLY